MTAQENKPVSGNGAQAPDPAAPSTEKASVGATRDNDGDKSPRALSMEDAKNILVKMHEFHVDKDEALLMEVTLHQAFFDAYERMLDHHRQAVRTVMENTVGSGVKDILGMVEKLRSGTLKDSLEGFAEQVRQYKQLKTDMDNWGKRLLFRQGLLTGLVLIISLGTCLALIALLYAIKNALVETLQALP